MQRRASRRQPGCVQLFSRPSTALNVAGAKVHLFTTDRKAQTDPHLEAGTAGRRHDGVRRARRWGERDACGGLRPGERDRAAARGRIRIGHANVREAFGPDSLPPGRGEAGFFVQSENSSYPTRSTRAVLLGSASSPISQRHPRREPRRLSRRLRARRRRALKHSRTLVTRSGIHLAGECSHHAACGSGGYKPAQRIPLQRMRHGENALPVRGSRPAR